MWRFAAGVVSALILAAAGIFLWQAQADRVAPVPPAPARAAEAEPLEAVDLAPPPQATEKTREQKRFARYDKDKNGAVAQAEYLANRRRGFAKLDRNGDGRLSFEEYAVKGVQKFAAADRDRNGALTAVEFATTRVVRKSRPRPNCPPAREPSTEEES